MKLAITINNIQHINKQQVSFDLSENKIVCITGKNSVGKTTLIRAIRNLSINSTFQETAAPYIFTENSSIIYSIDGSPEDIEFKYNKFINAIDSRQYIPDDIKDLVSVELPIPHGERFNHFKQLASIDKELRAKIAIGEYKRPEELIMFLHQVYGDERFENLKQVSLKNTVYYFILKDEGERFYIREDYFSSGEYFVVNLYKQIQMRKRLIVIDEIDISLDASAQVKLVKILRDFCKQYKTNIVFTTHSLALMKTLNDRELYYMECEKNNANKLITVTSRSYNFVKSIMYGFIGFDRYILTEDECLAGYIRYLVNGSSNNNFFQYQIIHIGGATQVIDLMERNNKDQFLTDSKNTLAVLDGDQEGKNYLSGLGNVILLPFWNIESEIFQRYGNCDPNIPRIKQIGGKKDTKKAKSLFKQLTKKDHKNNTLMSEEKIYSYLNELNPEGVEEFRQKLLSFLNPQ